MARNNTIKFLRTTRANLDSQAGSSGLLVGEPYLITDEDRIAVALTASTYATYVKQADAGVLQFMVDGGGATITTGLKGFIHVPFACIIQEWTVLCDQSGSIQFDLWKDTYANYPPVVGDTITASAKPLVSSATKGQSSTLTGWTTAVAAGDILGVNVDSVTTVQRATLSLKVKRA